MQTSLLSLRSRGVGRLRFRRIATVTACVIGVILLTTQLANLGINRAPAAVEQHLTQDPRFQRRTPGSRSVPIPPGIGSAWGMRVLDNDGNFLNPLEPITTSDQVVDFFVSFVNTTNEIGDFKLLIFMNYELASFILDGSGDGIKEYRFHMEPMTILDIPVTLHLPLSQHDSVLSFVIVRIPPSAPLDEPPPVFFTQHLRYLVRSSAFGELSIPTVAEDLVSSVDDNQGLDYELIPVGSEMSMPWLLTVEQNHFLDLRLKLRDLPGHHLTMALLDDSPIPLRSEQSFIYWRSEPGRQYEHTFRLPAPTKAGPHRLYVLSFREPYTISPETLDEQTSMLYTLEVRTAPQSFPAQ